MQYHDFTLLFTSGANDSLQVRVIKSDEGEAAARFVPPFSQREVHEIIQGLRRTHRTAHDQIGPTTLSLEEFGTQLFDSLFVGNVGELFQRCLGRMSGQEDLGLRLKLRIDPGEHGLSVVYTLPWEFLYQAETREFLGLSRSISIVRTLEVAQPAITVPRPATLRVLAVVPSPTDAAQLDLGRELRVLRETFRGSLRSVELDVVEPATISAVQLALQKRPYHILHFSGHGELRPSGESGLIFENEASRASFVHSTSLADTLRRVASLRLVLVNACNTATIAEADAFSSVASALVGGGIPAVIASQFPITDPAAINFSRAFYSGLSQGYSLDEAVAEGRLAIKLESTDPVEWGTPTLFTRLPDNTLFLAKLLGRSGEETSLEEAAVEAARSIEAEADSESGEECQVQISAVKDVFLGQGTYQKIFEPMSDLIEYVFRELEAGYQQARQEARRWSVFSLTGAGLAVGLVVISASLLLTGKADQGITSAVTSLLTGGISSLCFAQYRAATRRVDRILRELSQARDIHVAGQLAATIANQHEQDRVKVGIVKRLLENAERKTAGSHTLFPKGTEEASPGTRSR